MLPWRQAWHEALYGPAGFYRRPEGPAGHFTTSTQDVLGAAFARAIGALADREGLCRVVDVGCGRGELLTHLTRLRPELELTGVDIVARPAVLPRGVRWLRSPGGAALPDALDGLTGALVVAHEWLDVVPCTIAEADAAGVLREVLVDPATGAETLGDRLTGADAAWAARWWPGPGPDAAPVDAAGRRVEVGRSRDTAFAVLVSRVHTGVVLAVDYGHDRASRPAGGSLAAYRAGARVPPVPDGSCDLTAHVALDSLGAQEVTRQRDALRDLGLVRDRPPAAHARNDPGGYLAALVDASAVAALRDPSGLGSFGWALTRVR